MRKIYISSISFYFSILASFAQIMDNDSTSYKKKKLKLEEVSILTSYYSQNGNNSAVTGGIGTERLVDNSNLIELKFVKGGKKGNSKLLNFQLGVDSYSSASSDNIDPATLSSASKSDRRIYPSVSYTVNSDSSRRSIGVVGYFSKEYDYTSMSPGINFFRSSVDRNKSITVRLQAYFDNVKVILPIELRDNPADQINNTRRNTFNSSLIYSAVINKRAQFALLLDLAYQTGLLSTTFNRVFFYNNEERVEKLPDNRFKLPFGARLNYFIGDRVVLRTFYRFYYDSWNLSSHTFGVDAPIKITPFLSLGPVYRFSRQKAADYFAPYKQHSPDDNYYTSDYDLSTFTSQLIGFNFRKVSAQGILGIKKLSSIEIRYAYYYRSTNLRANSISLLLKFK